MEYVLLCFILVFSGASFCFSLASALVLGKILEVLKTIKEHQEMEAEAKMRVADFKQEIQLDSPTYPLRLR